MNRYPIAETVDLDLLIASAGAGVTGQTPKAVIVRKSDGYYYDDQLASGARFAATYADNAMTEVDAANFPGLYRYAFPHEEDATASEYFFVRLFNTGGTDIVQDQTIAFGALRTAISPQTCNLYGSVLDLNGDPDVNKEVRLSILPNTILSTGVKPGVSIDTVTTYTDAEGAFSQNLLRGLTVRLQILSIGYDRKITIPDAASANFADL